jgi:hypothetical protein
MFAYARKPHELIDGQGHETKDAIAALFQRPKCRQLREPRGLALILYVIFWRGD